MYKNIKNSKRLRYKKIKVFGILLLLIFSGMVTMSKAEESNQSLKALLSSNKTRFWFNSGFGPSTVKIASGGALSFQYSHLLVSLIFDHNRENILSGSKRPTEWISEIGITGGTSVGNRFGIIAFSFGPAYVAGIRRGNFLYSESAFLSGGTHYYEKEQFSTIGFTVRSHFIFTPRRFFGVGAHLYANLNAEEAFIGAIGGLYLGKFR